MKNMHMQDLPATQHTWPSQEAIASKGHQRVGIMDRWHKLAGPPGLPANAKIFQREAHRRARSLSSILFFWLPTVIFALPSVSSPADRILFYLVLGVIISCILSLLFNRAGKVLTAGIIFTMGIEIAVTAALLTMIPLDETALQFYDLYALVALIAIVVLPIQGVWIITICNCIIIAGDLIYQPRTPAFTHLLANGQFISIVTRPMVLLIIVAGTTSFLLFSVRKATQQAYQAEFATNLEHAAAEQNAVDAQKMQQLEESIQQLVQANATMANGQLAGPIAYPPDKIFWPLVGVMNTLRIRLQRSQQIKNELDQLQQEIISYNELIQRSMQFPEQPLPSSYPKTMLAPLIFSVGSLHRELVGRLSYHVKGTHSNHRD